MTVPDDRARERIERGNRAREIIESDVFKEALAEAQAATFRAWQRTKPGETERREWLFNQMNAFDSVAQVLRIWADSGNFEFVELRAREERERSVSGTRRRTE